MSQAGTKLLDRWRNLTRDLRRLRWVFSDSEDVAPSRRIFDEFLSHNELGLALHVACDFLLEPDAPTISLATIAQIKDLHSRMEIADDCVSRLKQKIAGTPGAHLP